MTAVWALAVLASQQHQIKNQNEARHEDEADFDQLRQDFLAILEAITDWPPGGSRDLSLVYARIGRFAYTRADEERSRSRRGASSFEGAEAIRAAVNTQGYLGVILSAEA